MFFFWRGFVGRCVRCSTIADKSWTFWSYRSSCFVKEVCVFFFKSSFQFCSGNAKNVCVRDADGSDSSDASDASDAACGVVDEEEEEEEEEENDDGTYVFVMWQKKNKRLETKTISWDGWMQFCKD